MSARGAAGLAVAALVWVGCEYADTRPTVADGAAVVVDARPVDTRPVDMRPVDTRPPDARVMDAPPAEARPVDAPPVDVRPPDAPAPDAPPPADAAPVDMMSSGADPEPGQLAGMTRLHNELRAQVSVGPLLWDPALAAIAQAYAERCSFQHSGRDGVGENLAANAPPGNTVAQAFKSWADEKASYDYAGNRCAAGKQCGHYTQVVWRNTTRLGCGVASCTTGSPFSGFPRWEIWVCNYAPPGNFSGERPY